MDLSLVTSFIFWELDYVPLSSNISKSWLGFQYKILARDHY